MKVIIPLALVVLVGVGISLVDTSYQYERQVEEVIKEVHPEWATDEDAVEAAQAVIRKKELEAQEADLVGQISTLQEELDEVRKELGTY